MNKSDKQVRDAEVILAGINEGKSEPTYQRDQIIYSQGDPAGFALYIRAGIVKVTVVSEEGKQAVVGVLQSGSFCGEECLAGHKLRLSTATTLTECELVQMARASAIQALHDNLGFSELFTAYLLERSIRVREDLADQLLNSTEKRLARLLLVLAEYGKKDQLDPILPEINQETLAEMIGATRTHVNFFLNKFRQLGFIEYNGKIKIKVNRSLLNMLLPEKP